MKMGFMALLVGLLMCDVARAASYAVNFDGEYVQFGLRYHSLPDNNAFGPPEAVQFNWNNVHAPMSVNNGPWNGSFSITDKSGGNSLLVSIHMRNAGGNDGGPYNGASDIAALYSTGLRDNDGLITITTTVEPYPRYSLYVYYGNNQNGGVFAKDVNYSLQTNLTGVLNFSIGSLNGFSIVGPDDVPGGALLIIR